MSKPTEFTLRTRRSLLIPTEEQRGEDRAEGHRELRQLCFALFGRPPLPAEWAVAQAESRKEFLVEAVTRPEFWRHWIEEQLYFLLLVDRFRPVGEAVDSLPDNLRTGRMQVRQALQRIALTSSFDARNPGADTFVTVVLETLCGLVVQKRPRLLEAGKRMYDGAEVDWLGGRGSTQADVIRLAVETEDFASSLVEREYRRMVGSRPEKRALASWSARLHKQPQEFPNLVLEWLSSDAFRGAAPRPLPNRLFVRALVLDLTGELPAAAEAEALRGALDALGDAQALRSVITRSFLGSGEVRFTWADGPTERRAQLAELFRRWLGREAQATELKAFLAVLAEPGAHSNTALYALLTDPGYHRY